MSKFLIVGDIHLGKNLNLGHSGIGMQLNSRVIDQINLLDWILDQALEHNVEFLVLTGDLTEESKPDYYLLEILLEFLKKCQINNIDVHIIAGNHDLKRTGSFYSSYFDLLDNMEFPNVFFYKNIETLHKSDLSVTFLPFRDKRSLSNSNAEALEIISNWIESEVEVIPTSSDKILIGHLALEGSLPTGDEFDDFANELMCPLSMFGRYDFTWMGHIHKPQVRSKSPYIAHIGSLEISNFGEANQTKILILFDSTSPSKFSEIDVPARKFLKIPLVIFPNIESTEFVIQELEKQNLKGAIVRLEIKFLQGANSINRKIIEDFLNSREIHNLVGIVESREAITIGLIQATEEMSPTQAVKTWAEGFNFPSEEERVDYIKAATRIIEKVES